MASVVVTAIVYGVRFLGVLQLPELLVYDLLMSWRPYEEPDERLLVVKITNDDLVEEYISYGKLQKLLEKLQQKYQPQVIGLDVYIDQKNKSGYKDLKYHLHERTDDVIATCVVAAGKRYTEKFERIPGAVAPGVYPDSPEKNLEISLGFSDNIPDDEPWGHETIRRYLLTLEDHPPSTCRAGFSLGFLLAQNYLEAKGIKPIVDQQGYMVNEEGYIQFEGYVKDEEGRGQFKQKVIRDLKGARAGGYQRRLEGGYQVLLNYRVGHPEKGNFMTATVDQIIMESFDKRLVKNRVVLIGYDVSLLGHSHDLHRDKWWSRKEMPGVLIHAHLVSQLLSAVMDERPLLWVWPQWGEALWILCWSLILSSAWRFFQLAPWETSVVQSLMLFILGIVLLSIICCLLLRYLGLWAPMVPPALAMAVSPWTQSWVERIIPWAKPSQQ